MNYLHTCLFQDGGGIVRENVICFLILRLPAFPKNIPVFWKLFCSTLKKKEKPIRTMGSKQGGQSVLNGILLIWSGYYAGSIWRNGEIQYRTVFLKLPDSSTPSFHIGVFSFFLNPPPILFSVDRLSIRLPPRISVTLENSSPPSVCAILPFTGAGGIKRK